ncbi:golgin subfamily A member 4 isoform X2 [Malaya genurostris]|uniref:golgin subfamily A member 4 isoform X2 n=1 Tax=Malaya genurostris TaxID=325434 RepID=UPI0026F3EE17|nr:golgin subfamily A member 4 isoform X2 [Malaya genurostris]
MFKKLKEKITEEVKQSPQRLEQLSKGLQAAVSSASSTTSEISGSENFFSITEDDTPQNSPFRKSQINLNSGSITSTPVQQNQINNTLGNNSASSGSTSNTSTISSNSINNSGNSYASNLTGASVANNNSSSNNGVSPTVNRLRRLSNSSMASDVSFRLPAYDSPAIYHLETDIDVSASETESVSGAASTNGQLDLVSKDKLFQAYKKALDRYQKYRERYTELARRYRELERDNTKARSVLVETQDKALRRISELREQCSLEQQAKAHLDSALRMEIDELQCVVKTLKTKLEAVGDLPDGSGRSDEKDLISLSGDDSINLSDKINSLEVKLAEEIKLKESLYLELNLLKKREEEHVLTVAENKMAIHSELESKESEVRKYKEQLVSVEKNMKQVLAEKDGLGKEVSELKSKLTAAEKIASKVKDLEATIGTCNEQKNKLESKFVDFEKKILELEKEKHRINTDCLNLEKEKENLSKKLTDHEANLEKVTLERELSLAKIEELENLMKNMSPSTETEALRQQITDLSTSKDALERTVSASLAELDSYRVKLNESDESKQNLVALQKSVVEKESTIKELQDQHKQHDGNLKALSLDLETARKSLDDKNRKLIEQEDEISKLRKTISMDQERLAEVSKALDAQKELHDRDRASNEASLKEVFDQNNHLTSELKQFKDKLEKVNAKFKKITEEKGSLKAQNEQLHSDIKSCKQEVNGLLQQKASLAEEIRNVKIINENSESEALQSLQESMRVSLAQAEERLLEATRDLNDVIELKSEENRRLLEEKDELMEKLDGAQKEKDDLATEAGSLKSKVESLRNEKKDLEKTLEREIREKTELKAQVTNILQEIGRLEDQLKDVKNSHSSILNEKQSLEEKIERLQRQHTEARSKADKDSSHKWQTKVKESETKLQQVECENSQLAEKNCLLEESNRRTSEEIKKLQMALQEAESALKHEKKKTKDANANAEELKKKCQELEEKIKSTAEQLSQCAGDHAKLFNEKELLDHQHRSLQDELEAKEKEKLCVLDSNKCAMEELAQLKLSSRSLEEEKLKLTEECDALKVEIEKVRSENDYLKSKQGELKAKFEKEKQAVQEQNNALHSEIDSMKNSNQNRLVELESLIKKANEEKQSFSKNATDLEKKLENYEEIKIENEYLNTLIKQLEGELHSLKEEKTKLLASSNGKETEITALKLKINQHELAVEEKDQEIKKLINEFVGKENEMKAKILTLEHGKSEAEKRLSEATTTNSKTLEELKVEKANHAQFVSQSTEDKRSLEAKLADYVRSEEEMKIKLEQTKTELEEAVTRAGTSQVQEITALKQQLATVSDENNRLKSELSDVAELRQQNENYVRDLEEMKSELNVAMAEKLDLVEQHSTLKEKFDAFGVETESNVQRFQTEIEQLRKQTTSDEDREEKDKAFDEMRTRKDELENKLKKIMHEVQDVSNRNLFLEQKCENYLILEQSNERLKLQNDKLSRQLDETLVSMHHSEGITANTEFEYLRNILFQYLSGNVTGNNSTLVKVISAVLKFTPQQTQVVLEKEAHRRSLINNLL